MGSRAPQKFYNYINLMKSETNYGKRMSRLRNGIFGDPIRPNQIERKQVVRLLSEEPWHKNERMTQWYPRHQETHRLMLALRDYGLFRDEHEDFKEEMIRLRSLRGKPPWNPKEKANKK